MYFFFPTSDCFSICAVYVKGFSKHTPTQLYLGWKSWGDVFRFKRNYYFRRYMEAIFTLSIFFYIHINKVYLRCFIALFDGIIKIESIYFQMNSPGPGAYIVFENGVAIFYKQKLK